MKIQKFKIKDDQIGNIMDESCCIGIDGFDESACDLVKNLNRTIKLPSGDEQLYGGQCIKVSDWMSYSVKGPNGLEQVIQDGIENASFFPTSSQLLDMDKEDIMI